MDITKKQNSMSSPVEIYFGKRDDSFKTLIQDILEKSNLLPKYIKRLVNEKNLKLYSQAFTAASADNKYNYEIFEQLGDLSANKFIVWYIYKRFPQIQCTEGVKVAARIRIKYGARQSFATLGNDMGFWPYISASVEERTHKKKDLLEDCLESFVGCTEKILDDEYRVGVGYSVVYDILSTLFDKIHISLRYEDLYDSKTRLKELLDVHKQLGSFAFIDTRNDLLAESKVYLVPEGCNKLAIKKNTGPGRRDFILLSRNSWILMGTATSSRKADAQQKASDKGLKFLNKKGWRKEIPDEYKRFSSK